MLGKFHTDYQFLPGAPLSAFHSDDKVMLWTVSDKSLLLAFRYEAGRSEVEVCTKTCKASSVMSFRGEGSAIRVFYQEPRHGDLVEGRLGWSEQFRKDGFQLSS